MNRRAFLFLATGLADCGQNPPSPPYIPGGYLIVSAMAFSPDGTQLLTGYSFGAATWPGAGMPGPSPKTDKYLALWDLETAKEIRVFRGYTDTVTFVAFLPGGTEAITASS